MSRYLPLLLVPVLAIVGPVGGQEAPKALPPLESRLGQTVTVVEAQKATDKALITHVWRMADGTPVMQAKSLTTGLQLTLVENTKATKAADRIKVYHWSKDGIAPAGCPTLPVAQAAAPAPATTGKVATTEGGLLPVLTKKEEPKSITTVAATKPAAAPVVAVTKPVATMPVATAQPAKVMTTPAPAKVAVAPAKPATMPTTIKTVQATVPAKPVVVQPAPVVVTGQPVTKPHLVGGCEVITVTENGKPRQFKVVGTARNPGGIMVQRCEALDNGQIITLNCGECAAPCATPCPPVVACAPKCEPVKPCPAPVACAPKVEPVKPCPPAPCPPAKVVVCEPVKKAEPCPVVCAPNSCCDGKGCDACTKGKWCRDDCDDGKCGKERVMKHWGLINVPVPGMMLGGAYPHGLPPQPLVPSFCTANSSCVQAAIHGPRYVPMYCVGLPFSGPMNCQIANGICLANDPVEAEGIKNTMHLMNVLAKSREWENRQWAADRLQMATLPSLKPYVEDILLSAATNDRAPHVKVAAIRSLITLKTQRPEMVNVLAQSMASSDPMVQQAAGQAMETLMKAAGILQAGHQK